MKVARKNQSTKHKNSDVCIATEYPLEDKDINVAIVELKGRYPDKERVQNLECKELGYVVKGAGKIVIEGEEVELTEGDMILIEPGEKYYWEGNMTLFVPGTPAWTPEQHKKVRV